MGDVIHTPSARIDAGRQRTVRCRRFDLSLHVRDERFLAAPSESQRNWLCERALEEVADDLEHLDRLSTRFVSGSPRPEIAEPWANAAASFDAQELRISGQQVMHVWQRPYMEMMARAAAESHGDVLEIGFGMGIAASYIQAHGVRSHTIIECNRDVADRCADWQAAGDYQGVTLVPGAWQSVIGDLGTFDGILFDTYPRSEDEYQTYAVQDVTFARHFFEVAAAHLRDGGRFVYFSNEIDSVSRRHQRALFEHFRTVSFSVCHPVTPPADCQIWWADSIVIAQAVK